MSSAQTGGKRAPSAWTKFVTKFYHDKKKSDKDYKFSQALKDAAKVYKKESKTGGSRDDEDDEDDDDVPFGGKKKRTVRRKKTTKKKRTTRK
jgi:hypothetical protein